MAEARFEDRCPRRWVTYIVLPAVQRSPTVLYGVLSFGRAGVVLNPIQNNSGLPKDLPWRNGQP